MPTDGLSLLGDLARTMREMQENQRLHFEATQKIRGELEARIKKLEAQVVELQAKGDSERP